MHLHRWNEPDDTTFGIHDHPYDFLAVTLRGSGTERFQPFAGRWLQQFRFYRAEDVHAIDCVYGIVDAAPCISGSTGGLGAFGRTASSRRTRRLGDEHGGPDGGTDCEAGALRLLVTTCAGIRPRATGGTLWPRGSNRPNMRAWPCGTTHSGADDVRYVDHGGWL